MAKSIISKHYQRILTQWPPDLLRPEISFRTALQRRIETRLKPNPSTTTVPSEAEEENVMMISNRAQAATVPAKVAFDEKGELEQVHVLYSFLENRYMKQYPLSEKMMKPASNPQYYDELLKEMDEAPRRSWFKSVLNRWKGLIRFS